MRIPLRDGRFLTETDSRTDIIAAVINERAARHYWPERGAVGAYGRFAAPDGPRFQVIGVSGDVRNEGLGRPARPEIYVLHSVAAFNPMHIVVRSPRPMESLLPEIRRAIQTVDSTLAIHHPSTMQEIVTESVTFQRVGSFMMTFFATAALLMAMLGVYGVVSYSVRQRAAELGTRLALGATGIDLLTLVVAGGLKMAMAGVAAGSIMAAAAVWMLFQVFEILNVGFSPFLSSTAIVGGVALAASFFPAWRATLLLRWLQSATSRGRCCRFGS